MGGLKKCSEPFYIFWPGNSTSLLWEEDFLLWEASKTFHNHFELFAWEQQQFIMGRRIFYYGRPQKTVQNRFEFLPGNSTSLLWEEGNLLWEASKNFHNHFYIIWPGNSTSLLWEEDFLLWEASKNVQKDFKFLAWEQHQFIMGGGFFIMGGLKKFSESFYIFGLGTAPVYYGRRIFYYGRPKKMFRRILYFWPGNSTSLLWEEDFLLWEASKNVQNHFIFLAWEQHQFIMGGGFFIMGGLKNFSQSL